MDHLIAEEESKLPLLPTCSTPIPLEEKPSPLPKKYLYTIIFLLILIIITPLTFKATFTISSNDNWNFFNFLNFNEQVELGDMSGSGGGIWWEENDFDIELEIDDGGINGPKFYSSVVVFGDSYSDNGHARRPEFGNSLGQEAPYTSFGGRYTNGEVTPEVLVKASAGRKLGLGTDDIPLLDYAYSGAQISNLLINENRPDTREQITQYLRDLSSGSLELGVDRVLHYIFIGINPIRLIIEEAIVNKKMLTPSEVTNKAIARIDAQLSELESQMQLFSKSIALRRVKADFLILNLPPLELTPYMIKRCTKSPTVQLEMVKDLVDIFNFELAGLVRRFTGTLDEKRNKVFEYDVHSLWLEFYDTPKLFGLFGDPSRECFNKKSGTLCSDSYGTIYLDSLHPTKGVHKFLAERVANWIMDGWKVEFPGEVDTIDGIIEEEEEEEEGEEI